MPRIARPTLITILLFAGFLLVTLAMELHLTQTLDDNILLWIGPTRNPTLINITIMFTVLADGVVEVPFGLAMMLLLWRLNRWEDAKRLFVASAVGELLYVILKEIIHRKRPEVIPHFANGGWYSYPSGHAMLAPVMYSLALLFVLRAVVNPTLRALIIALAILLPLCIAVSRVYLGVHYPTDMVGGLLVGSGWMLLWLRRPSPAIHGTTDGGR